MIGTTLNAVTATRALQILYVPSSGSDESLNQLVGDVLASLGDEVAVQEVDDPTSANELLDREHFDAIVVAYSGEQSEAISSLDLGLAFALDHPVIVLTSEDDEELTQRVLADGAVDCLPAETLEPEQLTIAVRRATARYAAWEKSNVRVHPAQTDQSTRRSVQHAALREPLPVPIPASLNTPIHPDNLRRRNKSGLLIAAILLAVVGVGIHRLWTAFFRYDAYGVVVGRTIDVSAPWEGQIKYVHVEEGQTVRQDDLLVTTENLSFGHAIEELDDELAIANADLRSKVSELKWNSSYFHDVDARTSTTYYDTWGQLLDARENVTKLRAAFKRAQVLMASKTITIDDFEAIKYELRGELHKVDKLAEAVKELRAQVQSAEGKSDLGTDQLSPLYAKIRAIRAKQERLRSQIAEGRLRSPVNGTVRRRNAFAGERCDEGNPIMTVVEETSTRVVVYYPQDSRSIPEVGDTVTVQLPPQAYVLECTVERVGDSFEPPPEQIARHYTADQKLLPVRMKLIGGLHENELRLGAVVMLPKTHSRFLRTDP